MSIKSKIIWKKKQFFFLKEPFLIPFKSCIALTKKKAISFEWIWNGRIFPFNAIESVSISCMKSFDLRLVIMSCALPVFNLCIDIFIGQTFNELFSIQYIKKYIGMNFQSIYSCSWRDQKSIVTQNNTWNFPFFLSLSNAMIRSA